MKILLWSALTFITASASALEAMSVSELTESCGLQLSSSSDIGEGRCGAYIQGYIAGSSQIRIGVRTEPASDLVQRALQTRVRGRINEPPARHYCIPESADVDQVAGQIVQLAADFDAEDAAEHLMLRVLQQYYRCSPA